MNTERLTEFLVLARERNFSRAAEKLRLTQPALSRHIREAETELGVRLFERDTHSVSLTAAGRLLEREAAALLRRERAAEERARSPGMKARGRVAAACSQGALSPRLRDFIALFSRKYREISLTVDVTDGETLPGAERYDLLFSLLGEQAALAPPVKAVRVLVEDAYLVLPPDHRLLVNHEAALAELADETVLLPRSEEDGSSWARIREQCERGTGGRVTVRSVPNADTALLMAGLGRGIAVIPRHLARGEYRDAKLVAVSDPECVFDIWMFRDPFSDNPAARLFCRELESFAQTVGP